jgi:hypothetical protein
MVLKPKRPTLESDQITQYTIRGVRVRGVGSKRAREPVNNKITKNSLQVIILFACRRGTPAPILMEFTVIVVNLGEHRA